jgi:hypothetical protein
MENKESVCRRKGIGRSLPYCVHKDIEIHVRITGSFTQGSIINLHGTGLIFIGDNVFQFL